MKEETDLPQILFIGPTIRLKDYTYNSNYHAHQKLFWNERI